MSLIACAVYDREDANRSWMTATMMAELNHTVDWNRHRLFVVDNDSCRQTQQCLDYWSERIPGMIVIRLDENVGQAKGLNVAFEYFDPGEHLIRIDNDFRPLRAGWADVLEDCVTADPTLGVVGIKKAGVTQRPDAPEGCWSRSKLRMLPGSNRIVEECDHILGFCCLINAKLFEGIGFLYQFGLKWGMEDVDYCHRAHCAGFSTAYIHEPCDDLDAKPSGTYQEWKNGLITQDVWDTLHMLKAEYSSGKRSLWRGAEEK